MNEIDKELEDAEGSLWRARTEAVRESNYHTQLGHAIDALSRLRKVIEATSTLRKEPGVCLIGTKGSAFDMPATNRAYTYEDQPTNVVASTLGSACLEACRKPPADSIDLGLKLLKELQARGFGVFALGGQAYVEAYIVGPEFSIAENLFMNYEMIDRFLRNNLGDDDYAEYSAALDSLCTPSKVEQESVELLKKQIKFLKEKIDVLQSAWDVHDLERQMQKLTIKWTPPQPPRKPLAYEQIRAMWLGRMNFETFARAIEAAHGIKEQP